MGRVLAVLLAAALTALGAPAALAADQGVTVGDNFFSPARVAVTPGDSVTWTAPAAFNPHNVRFEDGGLIEPSPPRPGPWTATRDFTTNGVYRYYCEIHGGPGGLGMSGVVFVNAAANVGPIAAFTASPSPAQTGETVTFAGAGSSDLDGTIAKYEWDLDGNGSFETDTLATPTASRSYATPGTLTIKLRVTDDDGATEETARSLVVNARPAPRVPVTPPAPAAPAAVIPGLLPPSFAASRRTITVSRSGRFSYSFAAGSGLTGTIGFRSIGKVRVSARRRISLGTLRFTVPASGIATVRVKLSRKNLRILRRNKRIGFRATVTLRNAAGASRSGTATLTLRRPRRG